MTRDDLIEAALPAQCERCQAEPTAHVVVLDGLEGTDYGHSIQFWGDTCVEGVVYGLDDVDTARRYAAHRPLRVPARASAVHTERTET